MPPSKYGKPRVPRDPSKAMGGRPSLYRPEYCDLLIAHMKEGLTIESFGAVCTPNVSIRSVYNWLDEHPAFAEARVIGEAHMSLFYTKMTRAMAVGKLEGNPTALIWLTKNTIGWRNEKHVTVSGVPGGAPITTRALSRDEMEKRYAELIAKAVAAK